MAKTFVVGVGMTRFEKPGARDWDYPDMAREAGAAALLDAGVAYADVGQVAVGYCYGDSTSGQRAVYELGLTGVPIVNVNNNCATGATALFLARQWVAAGLVECALALGFEKMARGSLRSHWDDREQPLRRHFSEMRLRWPYEVSSAPSPQLFGNAGRAYMDRYGVDRATVARVAEKNHRHSVNNPNAQFRDEYSLQEILASPVVYEPLTKLQCCPTSDGAACVVIASERFVRDNGLTGRSVEIAGMAMTTDAPSTFEGDDLHLVGQSLTRRAAQQAYGESGLGPQDAQVIELHDCFSTNELISYDALGLCTEGNGGELVNSGATTYGGDWVVNPSGGLISKGHPLGATGLAQCAELTWQLRGDAGPRQVADARSAIQHNLGLGGAAVVGVYRAPTGEPSHRN